MLTAPSVDQLADYAGRPVESFSSFAMQALVRTALMFQAKTGVSEWPVDELELSIITNGILELADIIYLRNAYREQAAKPYSTETVANWSYSIRQASRGEPTGLDWWDMAIAKFSDQDHSGIVSGGVHVFDDEVVGGHLRSPFHGIEYFDMGTI